MTRFTISTCGVLAEVAALDSGSPSTALAVGVVGVVVAVCAWWSHLGPLADHLVGLDL